MPYVWNVTAEILLTGFDSSVECLTFLWNCPLFSTPSSFLQPKYINQLLRAVEDRKKEQERRDERKIQKEREAEGEKFADKDAYVTSAYRQKLKEREEELEKEKRMEAMEGEKQVFSFGMCMSYM